MNEAELKGYTDEIEDLKRAIKYAEIQYHAKMVKELSQTGKCPICLNDSLSHGQETIRR